MTVDNEFWRHIWNELEPSDLPGDLELLAFDLGMDATRRLTEFVRGRLYVPSHRGAGGPDLFGEEREESIPPQLESVAEEVGVDVAKELAETYGGTNLYIPTPDSVVRVYRSKHLHRDLREADRIQEVADRYDISTERVMQLLRSEGEQTRLWEHERAE